MEKYDAIIVGGGILGLSTGYYLSKKKKILLLEKSHIGSGSTGRCIGGIRQQFSTPGTIKLAMESVRLFKEMEKEFGFSVEYAQTGYLLLAFTDDEVKIFKKNIELQKNFGIKVDYLDPRKIKKLVPQMNTDGVIGGAYSNEDGQAYPFLVLKGYFKGIIKNRGEIRMDTEVETLLEKGGKIKGVKLKDGKIIESDIVINAAGPWAGDLSMTIDYPLPFAPEKHEAFITTRLKKFFDPMLVDYRKDGCYFNQRLNGQIIGCYTPKPSHPGKSTNESFEFLYEMSRRAVRLVPDIKKAQVLRQWAGSYTMTPDGNPIIDKTDIEGYFIAGGMSGHGFMLGPATGKLLANYIMDNSFSFDMSEFSMKREFKREELLK